MSHNLALSLTVGEHEIHHVEFSWNQRSGRVCILVDGQVALQRWDWASWDTITQYAVHIGERERHSVVFEKTRPRLLAGLRGQSVHGIVDGRRAGEAGMGETSGTL